MKRDKHEKDVLTAAYILQIVLMLAMPVVVWIVLRQRWGVPWQLIGIGAVTFIASQIVHIPLLMGLTYSAKWLPRPPE